MKQGVWDSQTPNKVCIRSPEGETRSLRLTDSYQGLYKESGGWIDETRSLRLTDSYQGLYKESGGWNKESQTYRLLPRAA